MNATDDGPNGVLCGMLGIEHAGLTERMREGGTDEESLECACAGARYRVLNARSQTWS